MEMKEKNEVQRKQMKFKMADVKSEMKWKGESEVSSVDKLNGTETGEICVTISNICVESSPDLKPGECCCCLRKGKFEAITSSHKSRGLITYDEMLREDLGLAISMVQNEQLICKTCSIRLVQAHTFRKQVIEAERACIARMPVYETKSFVKNESFWGVRNIGINTLPIILDVITPVDCVDKGERNKDTGNEEDDRKDTILKPNKQCSDSDDDTPLNSIRQVKAKKRKSVKTLPDEIDLNNVKKEINVELTNLNGNEIVEGNILMDCFNQKQCKEEPIDQMDNGDWVFEVPVEKGKKVKKQKKKQGSKKKSKERSIWNLWCNFCKLKFETERLKINHVRRLHGIHCSICKQLIPIKFRKQHKVDVHGAKPYACGICDKFCYSPLALEQHQRRVHMNERNHACPLCDHKATTKCNLRKHLIRHKQEKNYECAFCMKKFVRKTTLLYHERIHTGDKRSVCKICGEAFVQRASLKYHLEKYHPGDAY